MPEIIQMKNVRIGLVGLGNMGKTHRAGLRAGKVQGLQLTAALYVFYWFNAWWAFFHWKRSVEPRGVGAGTATR